MLLRDYMNQPELPPLWNNVGCVVCTVFLVKAALEAAIWIRMHVGKREEARILVHLVVAWSCVVVWPLYERSDWSWRLNAVVPAALATRMVYKGFVLKDPDDLEVQVLARSFSPLGLVAGPLQLFGVLIWLGTTRFMTEEAAVIVSAVGIGDGIAPWIGMRYGRHVYRMPFSNDKKTMEGSVCGVFLGTIAGSYFYSYAFGIAFLPLRMFLAYGAIAAVVEASSPGNMDNLFMALVLHLSIDRVQNWLPS